MDIYEAHGTGSHTLSSAKDSTPGTPMPPGSTQESTTKTPKTFTEYSDMITVYSILGFIFAVVFSYGAAKLSYDKYRSVGWAVLDFFFSWFYYPYYAIVLNAPTYIGGRR